MIASGKLHPEGSHPHSMNLRLCGSADLRLYAVVFEGGVIVGDVVSLLVV